MKREPKAESVEASNRRRRGAARACGAGTYASHDPDDPGAEPLRRCTECDDLAGSPANGCEREAAHAARAAEQLYLFAEAMP